MITIVRALINQLIIGTTVLSYLNHFMFSNYILWTKQAMTHFDQMFDHTTRETKGRNTVYILIECD